MHLHALGPTRVPEEDTDGNIQLVRLRFAHNEYDFNLFDFTHTLTTDRSTRSKRKWRKTGGRRRCFGEITLEIYWRRRSGACRVSLLLRTGERERRRR